MTPFASTDNEPNWFPARPAVYRCHRIPNISHSHNNVSLRRANTWCRMGNTLVRHWPNRIDRWDIRLGRRLCTNDPDRWRWPISACRGHSIRAPSIDSFCIISSQNHGLFAAYRMPAIDSRKIIKWKPTATQVISHSHRSELDTTEYSSNDLWPMSPLECRTILPCNWSGNRISRSTPAADHRWLSNVRVSAYSAEVSPKRWTISWQQMYPVDRWMCEPMLWLHERSGNQFQFHIVYCYNNQPFRGMTTCWTSDAADGRNPL